MKIYTVGGSNDGLILATAKKKKVIAKCVEYLTTDDVGYSLLLESKIRHQMLLARQKSAMLVFVENEVGTEVCIEIFEE